MVELYKYELNNLTEDLEKKLLLYKNDTIQVRSEQSFEIERYSKFVEIIMHEEHADIQVMIDNLESYYQAGIEIKEKKLYFDGNEVHLISSKLYKELYILDSSTSFEIFLEIIQSKVNGGFNWWLDIYFDDEKVKEHFLENATNYIIENQNRVWASEFNKINHKRHSWLQRIDDIPESFDSNRELYFWLKSDIHDRKSEALHFIGNTLINYLLYKVIKYEDYHFYNTDNGILKILSNCQNDYITIGYILTHSDIRLNCFLLREFKYSLFAFLNLYNIDSEPHQLSDKNYDYTKEWQEMLANQLVNIFFKHFSSLYNKEKFSVIIFKLINYMARAYVYQYNYKHKSNYTLFLILDKVVDFKIQISKYEKKSLFDFVIDDIVSFQLADFDTNKLFDEKNYFLLSYFSQQIDIRMNVDNKDYIKLVDSITESILGNLKKVFNDVSKHNQVHINLGFLEKIDFGLLYSLSPNKNRWLELIDVKVIKNELNNGDLYVPTMIAKSYFKILLNIFNVTQDIHVAKYINYLAIELGLKVEYGIFADNDIRLYDDYLEILNIFSDSLFDDFFNELCRENSLKDILQLLSHSISSVRQEKIRNIIINISSQLNTEETSLFDIRESISYALYNGFKELSTELIEVYESKATSKNYQYKEKEFYEIVCQKELLDIYNDDISNDDKFDKLNAYKITFDDKGWGENSKQIKCENYKTFIRAIIFFDDEPIKTYKILANLIEKDLNSIYLINMLSAYLEVYKNDKKKKEKFSYILKEYHTLSKKLQNHKISLFEYQTLFYAYLEIDDEKKFIYLWSEIPKQYKYDLKIFELRCEFLQKNNQSLKAKEYIYQFKEKSNLTLVESKRIEEIEQKVTNNIVIEVENKLKVKVDFQNFNLTLTDAKNYWLQIKNMSDEEHAQIFSKSNNFIEFIKDIILNISKELLNRKINIQRQKEQTLEIEDIINDWVKSLLEQRMSFLNWHVKDQTRGGKSSSEKSPGEKDLEIFNVENEKLFLFEAFRLFSNDTSTIKEHINKLDGYNADGCKILIVMCYTHTSDFNTLCNNYQKLLSTFDYKGFDKLISLSEHNCDELDTKSSNIKLFKEIRFKNKTPITINHFLLDFK